jgi:uncharacterized protein YjbJ (UPF0337 family)
MSQSKATEYRYCTEIAVVVVGHFLKGAFMNWDQVEGKWKEMKGSIKEKWGKLTDDDLHYINGKRDQFVGRLQQRYGIAKEEAQDQLDRWMHEERATSSQPAKDQRVA